ncbi:ABC transporter permease [Nocardiopsis halophila]|uniref:ABC transporter permease n=1 Tax=Nocardiopsis halophila TaxID=141692 RepID=UPI00034B9270|nr:ABC transporter permease [Nocardiopsis halophila]
MGSVRAEFIKLRRSLSWAVVVLLPLAAVGSGGGNTALSGEPLADGWHTLWLRVVVFYGLFPLAVGVAALASLVWRAEHEGGNRNALMARPVSGLEVAVGKFAALAALTAAMQGVLVAGTVVAGKAVYGLPGSLPAEYLLVSVLIVVACLPVAALQSGLSMLMRSFGAPVAVGLLGAGFGVLLVALRADALAAAVPYSLLSRATQVGTGVFADPGPITAEGAADAAGLAAAALVLTAVAVAGTAAVLERRDVA